MIVVTGAAGFIGSALISFLNKKGFNDIVAVDDFSRDDKNKNLEGKNISKKIDRKDFIQFIEEENNLIQFVFHLGARTDTTEKSVSIFNELNLEYSKAVWNACVTHGLPLVYASSAATYGLGENGYDDDESKINLLKPLNPYGDSKNDFDKWALAQEHKPYFWVGLKFFNVYGPNEYHKGRMASVIFHSFNQIKEKGFVKLFRSHNPKYQDGGQLRDFVYVKDLCEVCYFFLHHRKDNGIYNLGTGKAETFLELATQTFNALNLEPKIEFIDTPIDIRDTYQYFTEASMNKLKSIGYEKSFKNLKEGVSDYVKNYLDENRYF